jgi:hypothetical protein
MSEFTTLEAPTNSQIPTLLATPVQKKKKKQEEEEEEEEVHLPSSHSFISRLE